MADGSPTIFEVPADWEALEDAFENNAPEVHSYLHIKTGEVLRVVDGIADPEMHSRISTDANYMRIDPVSSREQYRWMERFIPMVTDPIVQERLVAAIDGKGAFRRFKDVLMSFSTERERWFTFRSERLRVFMEAWLGAHGLQPVPRPVVEPAEGELGAGADELASGSSSLNSVAAGSSPAGSSPAGSSHPSSVSPSSAGSTPAAAPTLTAEQILARRNKGTEILRKQLAELVDAMAGRDLEKVVAFAEFLKARRASRPFLARGDSSPPPQPPAPEPQELDEEPELPVTRH
jgi:hypothetical protein